MVERSRARSVLSIVGTLAVTAGTLAGQLRTDFEPPPRGLSGPDRGNKRGPALQPNIPPPPFLFGSADFRVLDTVVGPWVNMNNVPFSPLALSQDGNLLAAVNPHASLVRIFDVSAPDPTQWQLFASLKTAWGPTSCAFWENPSCAPELLVTCSNSDALLWLAFGGRVQGLLGMPAEPSDLLVDAERDVAWVSCMAADVVVEVDLVAKKILEQYPIPSKHPAFLAFESGSTGDVLVAPMLSGNNTTVDRGPDIFNPGPDGILDLSAATKGLPDEDLFRLGAGTGEVEPVVTAAGTVLFAHGTNPVSSETWMLGTDAFNFELQSEPEARGAFSENRLALVASLPGSGSPVPPTLTIDLDDTDRITPGVQYQASRSVAQPWALAFDQAGNGYVAGLGSDNVTMLDSAAAFVKEWDVGSIPRGLEVVPKGPDEYLAVFCWGSNDVEIYLPAVGTGLVATLRLGPDPAPADVRSGRELFYSAASSLHGNLSCATCHVDGFSDLLAWDLSDKRVDASGEHTVPIDDKGPLVTQTLRLIEAQAPYHWRGERSDLVDFNPAFESLLGGEPLSPSDFDDFQAFVFSLQERANPNEGTRRRVNDKRVPDTFPAPTSAVRGQDIFWEFPSITGFTCQDCHTMPSGTNNDTFRDEANASEAGRSHFVVAPLMSAWRKLQPSRVDVEYAPGETDTLPVLGVSLSQTGLGRDLQDFMLQGGFNLALQDRLDVAAFLLQLDTGVPPLMHEGVRVGFGSTCNLSPLQVPAAGPGAVGPTASAGLSPASALSALPAGLSNAEEAEIEDNVDTIQELTTYADRDGLDLVVVAELSGQKIEGVFDAKNDVFDLVDATASPLQIDTPSFVDALVDSELVGMLFPVPRGMGELVTSLDPMAGGPPVVAGPGATSVPPTGGGDDDESGDGGTGTTHPATAAPPHPGQLAETGRDAPLGPAVHASGTGPEITEMEIVYVTTRVAKIVLFTDDRASLLAEYTPDGGPTQSWQETRKRRAHSVLLRDLAPSRTWDLRLVATSTRGTTELLLDDAFTTLDLLRPNHVIVSSLSPRPPDEDSGGTLRFTLDLTVEQRDGDLKPNYTPVLDVFVLDSTTGSWHLDQGEVQAPATDTLGETFVELAVSGLVAGDLVLVKVNDVDPPEGQNYVWSLPDTPFANRKVEVPYTGNGP